MEGEVFVFLFKRHSEAIDLKKGRRKMKMKLKLNEEERRTMLVMVVMEIFLSRLGLSQSAGCSVAVCTVSYVGMVLKFCLL